MTTLGGREHCDPIFQRVELRYMAPHGVGAGRWFCYWWLGLPTTQGRFCPEVLTPLGVPGLSEDLP